ncbi:hypothetical protein EC957_007254 [Mortierella hygrophila]|uniref:Kelch repeat protein n=1 Tax=Mortierella hygrophila TaxID=979708 RepID=A0A9P6JYN4_9FUNG|nr:hypothetical protein EC957_007254 [Mortierella hygrophila]
MPPMSSGHSMTVPIERTTLYMWDPFQGGVHWTYGVKSNIWNLYTVPLNVTKQSGIKNGVDLTTGTLYVPSGNNNGTEMTIIIPEGLSLSTSPMPMALMPVPVVHESFLWSTYRNSFLHYGGKSITGNTGNPYLNEYIPSTSRWTALTTSAYGGLKVIVFGGAALDGIAKSDIHTLDVRTLEWTTGKPADANQARQHMACAVSGDSFVAWGGESASMIKDATPIVYDMKNDQWTTQFNRFINVASTTTGPTNVNPPPSSGPTSQPDSPTNIAAIVGGIGGAVVAVFAIAGFLLYRRRRRRRARTRDGRHQDKDEDEEGISLAHPQNPPPNSNDDIEAERFAAPPPLPLNPRPAEDQDAVFHAVPRDPQGQQSTSMNSGSAGTPQSSRNPQSWSPYKERSQELTRMIANLQEEQEELEKFSVRK